MLTQRTMKMGVDVGTDLKVCPYSVVFGGDFQVKGGEGYKYDGQLQL